MAQHSGKIASCCVGGKTTQMILSNTEIVEAIKAGKIAIGGIAGMDPVEKPFNTSAVDLHLGNEVRIPELDAPVAMDLRGKNIADFLLKHSRKITITEEQPYTLTKGVFALTNTLEKVDFPLLDGQCYSARVEGKSSLARCGILVHFTAPTIHAGFKGPITLEMINLGPIPFLLYPGMAVCQLIIEEVNGSPVDAPNQFKGQTDPTGAA